MRTLTAEVQAAIVGDTVRVAHLLAIDFQPWVYLTDAGVNIEWDGNTYLASQFLGFSDLPETSNLEVHTVTVQLSGVDQSIISLLLQETYIGRRARIYKVMLTESGAAIVDPSLIMDGRIDQPAIQTSPDAGTCTASISIVSRWSPLSQPAGRQTNDTSQQVFFPGDLGFNQSHLQPVQINWGGLGKSRIPGFTTQ